MSVYLPSLPLLIEHNLIPTSKVQKKIPSPPPTKPKTTPKAKPKVARKKKIALSDDDDLEDYNEKTEKYIQAFEDMLRLKEIYEEKYHSALLRKVESQRETIRKHSEKIDQQNKERESKEKADRHSLKKRIERYDLKHDDSFLQNIPKSKEYRKLLEEKRKSAAAKSLKKNSSTTQQQLETNEGRAALANSLPRRAHTMHVLPGGSRKAAATTAPTNRESPKSRTESEAKKVSSSIQTIAELEKLWPAIEMPKLRSMEADFLPPPVDVDAALGNATRHEEKLSRKIHLKHLQYMYNMSAANRVATQRIMAKTDTEDSFYEDDSDEFGANEDDDDDDEFSLDEESLIQTKSLSYQANEEDIARRWSVVLAARPLSDIQEENLDESTISRLSKTTLSDGAQAFLPLTMDRVVEQSRTLEPKGKSTLWPNYLRAGKSVFERNVPILNFEHPYLPESK